MIDYRALREPTVKRMAEQNGAGMTQPFPVAQALLDICVISSRDASSPKRGR